MPLGLADHDTRHVAQPRVLDQCRGRGWPVERHRFGTERLGEPQHLDAPVALRLAESQQRRRLDRNHDPLRVEPVGEALAEAHQLLGLIVERDRDQEAVAREPGARGASVAGVFAGGGVDPVGRAPERELAQRQQVWLAEEPLGRGVDLLTGVDLAGVQACKQVVGRQVDQLDVLGLIENPVRQCLVLADAGDAGNDVVEALEVLHVERGPDADAAVEQLLDVLPALRVSRTRLAVDQV